MDQLSLGDVAKEADIPKGSAYYFYDNIEDIYHSLVDEFSASFVDIISQRMAREPASWMDIIDVAFMEAVEYYRSNPAACQLIIGPKTSPEIKRQDRENDLSLGWALKTQIEQFFILPENDDYEGIFHRTIEIADLMFCLSMSEHNQITEKMAQEAIKASQAYLKIYLSEELPRR